MALTESEKGEVVFLLGYPAKTLVEGSIDYSRRMLERFTSIPDHLEVRARKCLSRIRNVDETLDAAVTRLAVIEVDGMKTNPREREMLIAERKRLILQLSNLLDIPPLKSFSANVGVRL